MAINYYTQGCSYRYGGKRITSRWIKETIVNEGLTTGDISVVFCSDASLLEINRKYLNHDYYTDIITFDYDDKERGIVSGDLFISVDTVADNAAQYGVAPREEMQRVIIHGVLHLCGYGDKSDPEARIMREKENFYLARRPETEGTK